MTDFFRFLSRKNSFLALAPACAEALLLVGCASGGDARADVPAPVALGYVRVLSRGTALLTGRFGRLPRRGNPVDYPVRRGRLRAAGPGARRHEPANAAARSVRQIMPSAWLGTAAMHAAAERSQAAIMRYQAAPNGPKLLPPTLPRE